MKTLTATQARNNLGALMKRALNGEDIGIVYSATGQIVALRPVQVYSDDYAFREYGSTEKQMERLEKNLAAKDAAALKFAKLRPWRP
jgi:antitoxin (DNA-binding transcriptional repressor) of toxin-antitoxin stability system